MSAGPTFADRKFHLGGLSMTRGAQWALLENNVTPTEYVARHVRGDWGDVSENDRAENEFAIGRELRIWSVYHLPVTGEKIWVITEADRSQTTILLPEEY
jgi:hypothetical protein